MDTRFTFQMELHGAGGFAKVIKGRDNALERDIAVKVLDPLVTQFPEADQERFRREARILARLSHPNIPAIYDVDFSHGRFLIIFQFIEGRTIRKIIEDEGPLQVDVARTWFQQIASALDHAHNLGIVHRDVKPENIIITSDRSTAYLVDFGIAISAEDAKRITKSGFAVGTPGYMSPEQQAGEEVDPKSDIYSLAVTMYEALAGKSIPVGDYEELSAVNEAIPPQIDDLIRDCLLQKDRRLDSAKTFSSRLEGALAPVRPLSEVLAHGRLYELANSIEELTPTEMAKLPEGQRVLILAKLSSIVSSGDPNLQRASERLLELLITRGILLSQEEYRDIVKPAIRWAFEVEFGDWQGSRILQRALEEAAFNSRADAHTVLKEQFCAFFPELDFEQKEDWYLHSLRKIIQSLLANPSCTSGTNQLVTVLRRIDTIQRSKGVD